MKLDTAEFRIKYKGSINNNPGNPKLIEKVRLMPRSVQKSTPSLKVYVHKVDNQAEKNTISCNC